MAPTFGTGSIFPCVAHLYVRSIARQADAHWRKYSGLHTKQCDQPCVSAGRAPVPAVFHRRHICGVKESK